MPKYINKTAINFCTVLGAVFCILFVVYGLQHRLFTSQEALRSFVGGFGLSITMWGSAWDPWRHFSWRSSMVARFCP